MTRTIRGTFLALVLVLGGAMLTAAPAAAETHGPCGNYIGADKYTRYFNNCAYAAVVLTIDQKIWPDYDVCVPAKEIRKIGKSYEYRAAKVKRYLPGTYCSAY